MWCFRYWFVVWFICLSVCQSSFCYVGTFADHSCCISHLVCSGMGLSFLGHSELKCVFCTFNCSPESAVMSGEPYSSMLLFVVGLCCCFFVGVSALNLFVFITFLARSLLLILTYCLYVTDH